MFVDTSTPIEELHKFAESIGLRREWFQGAWMPHYDLTGNKRAEAIAAGAVVVDGERFVRILRRWRRQATERRE